MDKRLLVLAGGRGSGLAPVLFSEKRADTESERSASPRPSRERTEVKQTEPTDNDSPQIARYAAIDIVSDLTPGSG
jgi:hypothetical protein